MNIISKIKVILIIVLACGMLLAGCRKAPAGWLYANIDLAEAKNVQEQVDNGHMPGLLDPVQVANHFVYEQLKFDPGNFLGYKLAEAEDSTLILTYNFTKNVQVEIQLAQPVRQDEFGIWMVAAHRIK